MMPTFQNAQIPAPTNWEEFEDLCYEIWKVKTKDPNAKKNGRKGQEQSGVDIYCFDKSLDGYLGIQCKGKDSYLNSKLTIIEINKEIKKTKSFSPKLERYIFATTQPRDAKLQEHIREVTAQHRKKSLFTIDIYFWEDIKRELENQKSIAYKFYNQFYINSDSPLQNNLSLPDIGLSDIVPSSDLNTNHDLLNSPETPNHSFNSLSALLKDKFNSDIDYARDLIIDSKPKTALSFLENLKNKIWGNSDAILRFRILTNLASCYLALGNLDNASKLYIQALQYNPDDEKAQTNAGLGYLLLKDFNNAAKISKEVIKKNPTNGRAFSFYLQSISDKKSKEELENSIPKILENNPEVLHTIGFLYQKSNLDKAKYYYEKAYTNRKENQNEIEISYATIQLEYIFKKHKYPFLKTLTNEEKEILNISKNIYSKILDKYEEKELRKAKHFIIANRSLIHASLGDFEKAISDIDEVLSFIDDDELLKNKAYLYVKINKLDNAKSLLLNLHKNKKSLSSVLMLSELLEKEKRFNEAIKCLTETLEYKPDAKLKKDIYLNLTNLYLMIADNSKAQDYSDKLKNEKNNSLHNFLAQSNILKFKGNNKDSIAKLKDAIPCVTNIEESFILAEELFDQQQFYEASQLYKDFVDPSEMSYLLKRYVAALYYSNQLKDVLSLTSSIRERDKPYKFITEVEIDLYEKIGDLEKALAIITEYLNVFKDDVKNKLRKAFIHLRNSDLESVDTFLRSIDINDYLNLDLRELQKLAFLFTERNMVKESLQVIYELRRKYFDQPEAHMFYINSFFMNENRSSLKFDTSLVDIDVCVNISANDDSPSRWFIIEDRLNPELIMNEINLEHPFAKIFMGKKVGDKISISENGIKYSILEIKHKYIYALHYTMNNYSTFFPEREDFKKISVKNTNDDDDSKYDFSNLFDQIDLINKNTKNGEKYYLDGQLTLGAVSNFFGKNAIEVFGGFSNKENIGIRCSLGSIPEMNSTIELLGNSDTLVLDVLSLLVVHDFGLLKHLKNHFTDIIITQSTIDYLNDRITSKKGFQKRGYSTIHKENKKYFSTEIPNETITTQIENFSNLINWAKENLIIAPCNELLNVDENKRESLSTILLPPFYEAVLLAKEYNAFLYTDDLALRQLAKNDENVNGVWTQAILHFLLNKNFISQDHYDSLIIKLIFSNYHYISITANTLIKQLRNSGYFPDENFRKVFRILGSRNTILESSIYVAAEFLVLLNNYSIPDSIRKIILNMILDTLTINRNKTLVCYVLANLLSAKLVWQPIYLHNLYIDISEWLTDT